MKDLFEMQVIMLIMVIMVIMDNGQRKTGLPNLSLFRRILVQQNRWGATGPTAVCYVYT